MQKFDYIINDKDGIHARPAGLLVNIGKKYSSKITLAANGKNSELKTILSVMGLGLKYGDSLNVAVEGVDEEAAVTELKSFFETL